MLAFGCTKQEDRTALDSLDEGIDDGVSSLEDTDGEAGDGDGDASSDGPLLDMENDSGNEGMLPCGENDFCECDVPPHVPCDAAADTPIARAIGLNCPNEPQVTISTSGSAQAIGKRTGFGNTNAFDPQEGSQFVAMGSGRVADLDALNGCNSDLGAFDPGNLPAPLVGSNVGGQTCADNPALVGMGDCSNTIEAQLAGSANDYTELRFTAQVPTTVNSLSYSLAFFSYEYPEWYQSEYNDMYIGWLESEVWTGNISFDEAGAPISLNAGFLDYRDAAAFNDPQCAGGCSAPELHNTCMQGHAGTKWLTTTAGVQPGETITVVFAIFDMSDSILDSYVFLDNFSWGCDGDAPPTTVPIG
ncbi:MAG TPA: choice-of-anchor L domain-containing protein [Enhygromyxa sp.]|nr:choice-of-anchor L domain-containing protein [Enhygromyxa sp.]